VNDQTLKVLGIAGSLRKASYNRGLLHAARDLAPPGVSLRTGTIRAQLQLRQAFLFTEVYALLKPEVAIPRCREKFDAEGRLTDEATRGQVRKLL